MDSVSKDSEELNLNLSKGNQQSSIEPIGKDVIHRICSGQVVLSLAVAMKELVENSIDAGATIIDIHLIEYGSELLEVSDNGSGVDEGNFEALTLKHYTSKIKKFEDLVNVSTLGFRGEALSSLCALCDLTVSTKDSSAQFGTKLIYDHNGKIVDKVTMAREQGTTVTIKNLFSTLPVRKKEFLKNLKREFGKMCQLLYAYCMVSKGIKFTCTNMVNNSRNTVVATDGKHTVRENIINVFGAKQISSLLDVEIVRPEEPILTEYGLKLVDGEQLPFTFEFLISSVIHGSGRSTTDRQFYFINNRPCEPTKLMKLVNEIYKQYNSNQYPFVYMNIITRNLLVDVNVTPDKRQIFVENEKILLATVKASLLEAFNVFPSRFKRENGEISQILENDAKQQRFSKGIKRNATEGGIRKGTILDIFKKRAKTEGDISFVEEKPSPPIKIVTEIEKETEKDVEITNNHREDNNTSRGINRCTDVDVQKDTILATFKKRSNTEGDISWVEEQRSPPFTVDKEIEKQADKDLETLIEIRDKHREDKKTSIGINRCATDVARRKETFLDTFKKRSNTEGDLSFVEEQGSPPFTVDKEDETQADNDLESLIDISDKHKEDKKSSRGINRCATDVGRRKDTILDTFKKRSNTEGDLSFEKEQGPSPFKVDKEIEEQADKDLEMLIQIACKLTQDKKKSKSKKDREAIVDVDNLELSLDVPSEKPASSRPSKVMDISLEELRKALDSDMDKDNDETIKIRFRSEIKPENNKAAEEELQRQISKEDFEKMEIIGQFNLGFIITRLNNDLFIIDQHATDEKYNFEQLQTNTVLESQVLVNPKPLELTAGNEALLIENIDVFTKNGFAFKIDDNAPCTKKVSLTAIPVSRNFAFGKDDIDEMLFLLQESSYNVTCRPSRVRAMFASRACRKSVMIGKSLSKPEMRKLVNHMGEIEHPWNCPHGRPTMRHLLNLDLIDTDD